MLWLQVTAAHRDLDFIHTQIITLFQGGNKPPPWKLSQVNYTLRSLCQAVITSGSVALSRVWEFEEDSENWWKRKIILLGWWWFNLLFPWNSTSAHFQFVSHYFLILRTASTLFPMNMNMTHTQLLPDVESENRRNHGLLCFQEQAYP